MAAKWRLAKGLTKLRKQLNDQYPNRLKVSDGSIGDTAHSSRASDHNPNEDGVVTAIDITHDPETVDGNWLSRELIRDSRTKYVIYAGEIWKARTGKWEPYRGPNRHDHHVHISIKAEQADNDRDWSLLDLNLIAPEPVVVETKKDEQPAPDVQSGAAKSGEPAPDVPAEPGQAVVGGRPEDPAKEVTRGSIPTRIAIGGGVILSALKTVWDYINGNPNAAVIGIICITVLILVFVFRQIIMDYLRLQLGARPDRYNVK